MAYRTHSPELGLLITIRPRAYTRYHGTAEQLVDEGLIPKDFKWPTGTARACYEIGQFSYWMGRCRPDGMKGPVSLWSNGDYWGLQRGLTTQDGDGFRSANIHEKAMELAEAIHRGTPEWSRTWAQAYEARKDQKYAAFRELLTGPVKRGRGRPAKSAPVSIHATTENTTTKGASNV